MTAPHPESLVDIRSLTFGYGERVILDDISLTVARGKVTALMGASGGGKTTVLRLIGGQYRAQRGELLLNGQDILALSPAGVRARRASTVQPSRCRAAAAIASASRPDASARRPRSRRLVPSSVTLMRAILPR